MYAGRFFSRRLKGAGPSTRIEIMRAIKEVKWSKFLAFVLCLGLLTATFCYTVSVRKSSYGQYPEVTDSLWRSLINETVQIVHNWNERGFLHQSGLMILRNISVESGGRGIPYVSYPPLFSLLPYLLGKFMGFNVELPFLMNASLTVCALSAALIFSGMFLFLLSLGIGFFISLGFALLCGEAFLLFPASVIFFQNAWWADVLVLPAFVALAFWDFVRTRFPQSKRIILISIGLVLFGVLSDWLFYFLLLILIWKHFKDRGCKKIPFEYYSIPAIFLFIYGFLIVKTNLGDLFFHRFLERTGVNAKIEVSHSLFSWLGEIRKDFLFPGYLACIALFFLQPVLMYFLFWRKPHKPEVESILWLLFSLTAPLILHFGVFHEHYYDHTYNILKYSVVLSLIFFGLVPAFLLVMYRPPFLFFQPLVFLFCLTFFVGYSLFFPAVYRSYYDSPTNLAPRVVEICSVIRERAEYSDIIFYPASGEFEARGKFPVFSEFSANLCRKNLYPVFQPQDIFDQLGKWHFRLRKANYRVWLLTSSRSKQSQEWQRYFTGNKLPLLDDVKLTQLDLALLKRDFDDQR